MKISRHAFIIIVFLSASACGGVGYKNQADLLSVSVNRYSADFRWGRYHDAYRLHVNQAGQQSQFDLNKMDNYSITDFRVINPVLNETATGAEIPVEIDYIDKQYGTVSHIKYTQTWWFSPDTNRWFIESPFPAFK